ncbi:nematode fatty acid retinoid binding protein [Ancylostoma caninum]|uniref:Fatty-acid and retinol-binding protein 1 n=1 Tax=Ancylostoma caninum TaxID=29170 RepID=A0A368G580_ANCCA|nr:nematode fatty acid retinoid binding protein [Ancylostoma caninum]
MIRHSIIAVALIALVWAAAIPEVKEEKDKKEEKEIEIPEQYKKLLSHATKHLSKFTPEEKEKLKDFAKKVLVWMMAKAKAKLSKKGEVIKKILEKKVKALGDEAKGYITKRLEEAYKFHKAVMAGEKPKPEEIKKWAENTISSYKALSEDAKKDIAKQFPIAVALAKNEKVREIVKFHLAMKFGPKTKDAKEVATPEQYRKLIATHILKHLAKLTPEEKEKLKVVAKKALIWLLARAKAKLGIKGEISRKIIEKKVKALDDEARKFVVQRLEQAYKLHKMIMAGEKPKLEQLKMWAENTISNYKELSDEAKEDIAKQFPIAHGLIKIHVIPPNNPHMRSVPPPPHCE